MKQPHRSVRALLLAVLSASALVVGADAVEIDSSSPAVLQVNGNEAPASASQSIARKESSVPLNASDTVESYQVSYRNSDGSESTATVLAPKVPNALVQVRVDTNLRVRKGPGTYYAILCTVDNGTSFPLTGKVGNWYQVLCNGHAGYISTDYAVVEGNVFPNQVPNSPPPANSPLGTQIVNYAMGYLGYPYVYAASGPNAFDCSGFTSYVYAHFGYTLHRSSKDQVKDGVAVSKTNLQPGDVLLFSNGGSGGAIGHVGIYIGNNKFIHASTPSTGVIISDLDTAYYIQHYIGARRII